jgi:pyruvate dehydrogenase E1 component alpha subunit
MAELMGKESGCSRGYGGSMHMFNPQKGFMGGNGIVGGGIPLALGAAFAAKFRKTDNLAVAFFGEGASNQGTLHETLNLAALKQLPLLAVCENNRYAATTPVAASTADEDMTKRAAAYGIAALTVDGNDVTAVIKAVKIALKQVRGGNPFLLDCKTYRVEPHCGIIADSRPKEERLKWQVPGKDPLNRIISEYPELFTQERLVLLEQQIAETLEDAVNAARKAESPSVNTFIEEFQVK